VRCPILIGRQEPAALISAAVRQLSGPGRGGALIVTGEAGIGKSRLAEHMSAVAAQAGVRVVTGRAMPAGIGGPLGPFAELILEVTRGRPVPGDEDLAPYLAVLASVVPHWRPPGSAAPAEPVLVTAEAVLRVLRWATGGHGVVAILEDLHWAHDATLAVARYLVDHRDEVPGHRRGDRPPRRADRPGRRPPGFAGRSRAAGRRSRRHRHRGRPAGTGLRGAGDAGVVRPPA
jgi:AAA ATPase domain